MSIVPDRINYDLIVNNLKVILGNNVEDDMVKYISSIEHEEDYEDFMDNILDRQNPAHTHAYNTIKYNLFPENSKQKQTEKAPTETLQSAQKVSAPAESEVTTSSGRTSKKDKKTKFQSINTFKQKQKAGRRVCDCIGQEHEFMNNCMECGRIHCYEEGPGPCLFCGARVSAKSNETRSNSMKHKKNSIFDDDKDYFKTSVNKSNGDKKKLVVALDFASRKVIESTEEDENLKKLLLQDSIDHLKRVEQLYNNIQSISQSTSSSEAINNELADLLIKMRHKKPLESEDLGEEDSSTPILKYETPVFDEDFMGTVDQGLCLSMHQPYASLLVAGVKRHEGRVWPTTHKGRLWIAATVKQPDEEEIAALEDFYRKYYGDPYLKFPKHYPTGCLLGCVNVEECLDEYSYSKKFKNKKESESPFVIICSNPIILPIFYPISGKPKIYPLDKELHKCAKLALQHAKYI